MKLNVLIICKNFPPINSSSVHRTLSLCRQLDKSGHEITILTLKQTSPPHLDKKLYKKVPAGLNISHAPQWSLSNNGHLQKSQSASSPKPLSENEQVERKGLWAKTRKWLSWWLRVPDVRIGWLVPAVFEGLRLARKRRPDVIYSTAPAWTAHLIGLSLGFLLNRPWVADCRDPWCANPFRPIPFQIHRWVDRQLENLMVDRSSFVICNTPAVRQDLINRYQDADKFVVIPNGYNETEIKAIQNLTMPKRNGYCQIVHTGGFYGCRDPMPLFRAIKMLEQRDPELSRSLKLCQVGLEFYGGQKISEIATQMGVRDFVEIIPPLPHELALKEVRNCDVALVAGHYGEGSDLQIPRKFFEYLGLGKPILVTGGTCSAVKQLIRENENIWFGGNGEDDGQELSKTLEQILLAWQKGEIPSQTKFDQNFTEARMARNIERVLLRAQGKHRKPSLNTGITREVQTC